MTVKRSVKFQFAGVERKCDITLALVMPIEDATDTGLIELIALVASKKARLGHIAAIIRETLAANGMQYTHAQILEGIERDGLFKAYASATVILQSFFEAPENAPKKAKAPDKTAPN
jgi:hypothetical protein